jgi:hypothetical protein
VGVASSPVQPCSYLLQAFFSKTKEIFMLIGALMIFSILLPMYLNIYFKFEIHEKKGEVDFTTNLFYNF